MTETFLGFDFGMKRIGVAVGSRAVGARPLTTIVQHAAGPDWREVEAVIRDWAPAAAVVGVPYNADGSAHTVTHAADRFADELGERFGLPVHKVDERYSSLEAEHALAERRARGDRRRVRRGDVDAAAAAVILSDWLGGGTNG